MRLNWDPNQPYQMGFTHPLVPGNFIERPNRFVAYIDVNGQALKTHVPDPGRLRELLIPGVRVMVQDHGDTPERKTRYSLCLVQSPDGAGWVSLNTQLPNRVVRLMLEQGLLESLSEYRLTKPEFTYGASRFDFLLTAAATRKTRLLEVKSVTLVMEDKTACFPDAPTIRGTRHLRELIAAKQCGAHEAGVLFVVQRGDAVRVCPNPITDPDFFEALRDAFEAGISLEAISYHLSPEGIVINPGYLPVSLS